MRFGANSTFKTVTPVVLPPGRFRLATRPSFTGSLPPVKTIGSAPVTGLEARAVGVIEDELDVLIEELRRERDRSVLLPLK